ncbi:MAG: PDZ domain-containing protein, partial [Sphingobacteriales bacterium]
GLDAGDVIVKADGQDVKDQATWESIIGTKKPGDKLAVKYKNRTGEHDVNIELEENPNFEVITFEKAGRQLSTEQLAFRNNWLQSKVK